MGKKIEDMLEVVKGSLVDETKWPNNKIDTIVNAAKPTLLDGGQGVDGAIRSALDAKEAKTGCLEEIIDQELQTTKGDIRCKRGQAVRTSGGKLCKNIIHVVGAQYDGEFVTKMNFDGSNTELRPSKRKTCTSSCVKTLESCYQAIIEEVKKRPNIKYVGIPIIGSGEYEVPFKIAAEIAVASVGNALMKWRNQDEEMFETAEFEKIFFFVLGPDGENGDVTNSYALCLNKYLNDAKPIFSKNHRVVCHNSLQSSLRYWQEIIRNDSKRGYFAIVKLVRIFLWLFRFLFMPILLLKDLFGGKDWAKRRVVVEWLTVIKTILPMGFLLLMWSYNLPRGVLFAFVLVTIYFMFDTISYLSTLILMADIQNPSANLIRSVILLFFNYIEIASDFAFLYYRYKGKSIAVRQALEFGILGKDILGEGSPLVEYVLAGTNTAIKFFFVTLVLSYFMGHVKLREFRS